jgi:predicted nucleic acid-binding protein
MGVEQFLADTSAVVRLLRDPALLARWESQIHSGTIAICPAVELELGRTAQSAQDYAELSRLLRNTFTWEMMSDHGWDTALDVQDKLISQGTHRSAGPIDLVVAATANRHYLTVLHCDKDFDCIAKVTGQRVIRVDALPPPP